ncbi:MAG TPA: class I SAM-dependent methyltransferase [Gemmatimonadaceae bacterium]|jgi:hypothetical protein|nr:class I SAM-dependent methyltransferase [Gemmatimonadaceae bacterium]
MVHPPADGPLAWIDALLSAEGQALLAELAEEPRTADTELRIITRYRTRYRADLVSLALAQVKLRERARAKFSRADRMYFTAPGLEQASTERMAVHHSRRFTGFAQIADLCSGIGGDLTGFARDRRVIAVDTDPVHSRLGVLNADAYGAGSNVIAVCADVREFDYSRVRAAFIDPARRSGESRMRAGESEPPLDWCLALAAKGVALGIKASPALGLDVVPEGWETEFVSEHRELKEAVLWAPVFATTKRRATVLVPGGDEHTLIAAEGATLPVRAPGAYLLDPDPSVTRAGLVETLGAQLNGAWKIDDQIAFLSADIPLVTPFGRLLRVDASMPWSLNRLREALRALDVGSVDIRKRGSAVDVDEIQRRLKLRGARAATVVLTRAASAPWAMVCSERGLT